MVSFEIIRGKQKISEYQKDWDRIFESGAYEVSTSYEWTQAILESTLQKTDEFFLVVIKKLGKVTGLIPLLMRKGNRFGISIAHLLPVSDLYHTHGDLLLDELNDEITRAFVTAIFSLDVKWDVFRMTRLLEANSIVGFVENYLKKSSLSYEIKKDEPTFFLSLNCSYDNYLKNKSHKFRKNLKYNEKKIRELGDVQFRGMQDMKNIEDAYNDILSIEKNSWKHIHGNSFFDNQTGREFYKYLLESTSTTGMLHLLFLVINSEPVAYAMGCIKDNRYLFLRTSYHEKYRSTSPSTLLIADLIEDLIQRGIKELDFTGEPHEYQTHWTNELRWHRSLFIYNNTIKGKAYSLYHFLKSKKEIRYSHSIKLRKRRDFMKDSDN